MIKRKYFGTDGVRGLANTFPMTPDIALKLGAAAGRHFRKDQKQHRVVIGKDTRRSSYMFENALTAGFTSTGMDVYLLGPVPTPAVGVLTRSMRADVGVMISASHNSYLDNGIKFFGPDGFKLSDKVELKIEELLDNDIEYADSQNIGMAKRIDDALGRYMEFAKSAFPRKKLLNGLKVVVDCANGAAYKAAPIVLWELGAEVISIGVDPNGYNINKDCGSTYPQNAANAVLEHGADVGICLDGDADNGIKFFGPDGFKLSDKVELKIEELLDNDIEYADPQNIGMAKRIDDALGRYMEFAKSAFPRKKLLNGLKVVVDCANGAAYKAAPIVLWELGAEVISIGVDPNGYNINKDCGSTYPQNAANAVLEHGADVGICLDGDADRLILIDDKGNIADGDQLMGLIASQWSSKGQLAKNTLVATVMSNMGLERHLNSLDIKLLRTNVGDRYVVEEMQRSGYNLGGEQSGHIVMTDYATTGDGLMAALQFLNALVESKCSSSELVKVFEPMPQLLKNVRLNDTFSLDNLKVQDSIKAGEDAFGSIGRLLIRKSGTEPLLRVMGECEDPKLLKSVVENIVETVDAIN